jgi:lysophospholipase L1-like esterase
MQNRRSFLKGGAAAAGLTALTSCANSQTDKQDRENPSGVGGYHYNLPKFSKGMKLLFQGDSITDMKWGRNQKDRNHYLGHSYVYLICSRLGVDMPQAKLEFFNRGVSGNTVGNLRQRWQKDAIDINPDLLSILVGVNDVGRNARSGGKGIDLKKWEEDYRYILDASRKANPSLKIVLLNPFVLPSGRFKDKVAFSMWKTEVDKLIPIVEKLVKDYDAVHIKTNEVFDAAAKAVDPAHWIWDGVHPLPEGHELIARNWISEVSKRW